LQENNPNVKGGLTVIADMAKDYKVFIYKVILSKRSGLVELLDPVDEGITILLDANNHLPVNSA
jgi:hypothetical protein